METSSPKSSKHVSAETVVMFKFVKYARLRSLATPESVGDAEKNIAAHSEPDHAPLLQGHVEGGDETIQGTMCPSVALFLSLGSLVFSVLFYAVAHHRVATDLSCQHRMWAYSESRPRLKSTVSS